MRYPDISLEDRAKRLGQIAGLDHVYDDYSDKRCICIGVEKRGANGEEPFWVTFVETDPCVWDGTDENLLKGFSWFSSAKAEHIMAVFVPLRGCGMTMPTHIEHEGRRS